ncbi:MAG: hypothetical protein HFI70_12815 [Lachnospiraceae bacterium]|nr:hypothetical protein [Lachnospiraceae bacterium]
MLEISKQKDKTFEEWLEEDLQKIPLYTREWTNLQPSDPGITILENFIAFQVLQQSQIQKMTPEILQKLLKFAGIVRYSSSSARVLLEAKNLPGSLTLPQSQQFLSGETIFETNQPAMAGQHQLLGVYGMTEGKILDAGVLLQPEIPLSVEIFGNKPSAGNAVYFIMNSLPEQEEIYFYIRTVKAMYRNAFDSSVERRFAHISWQCYTKKGFEDICCQDHTWSFLTDGELVFSGIKNPKVYEELPVKGCCIRGVLKEAEYDIAPKLLSVHGFLIEAFQRKTGSVIRSFGGSQKTVINFNLPKDGYFRVFCREGPGTSYRRYDPCSEAVSQGRYYECTRKGERQLEIKFDRERFGYGPAETNDAVRVVIYTQEMMQRYELGMVYGYDNQEIKISAANVLADYFCLLAERKQGGKCCYDFVKPGQTGEGDLNYELMEEEGIIRIKDAGDFIQARLFLAAIATCQGEEGNVRENSFFIAEGDFGRAKFVNPAPAAGGRLKESVEAAKKRFYQEMKRPETVICAEDYEETAKHVPGLCIHKVRAVIDANRKEVLVVVKPWTEEEFPKLTPVYKEILEKYFEPRRILTTRVCFASPRYVLIDVRGIIYVKSYYEYYMEEIEDVINRHLDYRRGPQNFGETLKFEKLFSDLEKLDCIVSMRNLEIYPQNRNCASREGMDIYPAEDCLCCPGNLYLDIHTGLLGGQQS